MRLNAPIPGANYLADTRNYAWHRPPDIVDYDEAVTYIIDRIDEPEQKEVVFAMLGIDAHISTVTTALLLQAVSKGKIGIDLAVLIAGPVARYIEIVAKDVDIEYDMGIEDKNRIVITPTLLRASLGLMEGEQEVLEDPENMQPQAAPQQEGLMAMPDVEGVASEEEQAAMLGGLDEEEPTDEL